MQIKINRQNETVEYNLPFRSTTLLSVLYQIKSCKDNSLTFSSNCRSGVCGACAVRVNGKEVLACSHTVNDGDLVEPLRYHEVQRDLKVNKLKARETLKTSTAWLQQKQETSISSEQIKVTEKQSDCILCDSCYSACPVLEVNPNFIGPFALTRAFRYTADPRESDIKSTIDNIQINGIWDCTLCGECTEVCPQGIDPKMDIMMLRGTSAQFGYSDPNFQAMDFGFGGFG
ncbi:succinate dehydrogenase/fumarate reductase iron-sulfur subunit [Sulfurovum sp. bin170]|uniref:succinate dehydrogenase/fumarate reductase iron-sulfur subunit n=1 Tax=Sulfurovum sp. bin170 TaxID=2695268 RepID=UPI0013DFF229|nr:2Fe-2S iron-sulfur cluster-binding protein [Sulfurovum sp. bin170]NEW61279.1 succinate dehydrogenase/fumarate reductase iron-sulfur subunit [Sulfurovum sp. bin170]